MKSLVKNIYLQNRLLYALLSVVVLFFMSFPFGFLFMVAQMALVVVVLAVLVDLVMLYSVKAPITGERIIEDKLSNGDFNPVVIQIQNHYGFQVNVEVRDEYPVQLQLRDSHFSIKQVPPKEGKDISYEIRPTQRGIYQYGDVQVFAGTFLDLIRRRVTLPLAKEVSVYPSIIQLRQFSFYAISNRLEEIGVKKIRKLGFNNEFEQIREYVRGDDFRVINWKATARRNELMVNQFQEEKSQNVYCLIDKGRLMHMPFSGLSLIDYAINASLVLSSIAQGRGDKAGLITFSDKIGSFIMAERKASQMHRISEALYNQDVRLKETDFLRLYKNIKFKIKKRSLLLLFTNFDSLVSLHRQLKYLVALNKDHLLVVVLFDNTEIKDRSEATAYGLEGIYRQTVAEKFQYEKRNIVRELRKNGIYSILTEPQNLTVNAINKYIELKARGAI